jgi:hypothetical protein
MRDDLTILFDWNSSKEEGSMRFPGFEEARVLPFLVLNQGQLTI